MSQLDFHRAAYLTMHGWTCSGEDAWSKDGVATTELSSHPCPRGCCQKLSHSVVREFGLETAYWMELERQSAVLEAMES